MPRTTIGEFRSVLAKIQKPGGRQLVFLRAHQRAPGHVLTARRLAEAAGYKTYDGINLQYGLLAKRIGKSLGFRNGRLDLLVEFVPPRSVSNREWVLAMRKEFAAALKAAKWV
jgi:hypothetical protein